jgi:hypothetical protein
MKVLHSIKTLTNANSLRQRQIPEDLNPQFVKELTQTFNVYCHLLGYCVVDGTYFETDNYGQY